MGFETPTLRCREGWGTRHELRRYERLFVTSSNEGCHPERSEGSMHLGRGLPRPLLQLDHPGPSPRCICLYGDLKDLGLVSVQTLIWISGPCFNAESLLSRHLTSAPRSTPLVGRS